MSTRKAVLSFLFWVVAALAVDVGIWLYVGGDRGARLATEFFGAWAMEEALSLDNLFMFYFIFSVFQTPLEARPRVLRWGILGVILMRGAIILGGTTLLQRFQPLLYVFAVFLLWAAFKIFFLESDDGEDDGAKQEKLERNWLVRLSSRVLHFEKRYDGSRFWTTVDGRRRATLLLLVVLVVEGTDVPFAFDSLPAAMAISQNFWIVLVSNLLAVMGLRSIYFLIQNMRDRFAHMQQGIGILLAFAGLKILLANFGDLVNHPEYGVHLPLWFSVAFIGGVIAVTIAYTLLRTRRA
jgi:tellurite resistance protein TerC